MVISRVIMFSIDKPGGVLDFIPFSQLIKVKIILSNQWDHTITALPPFTPLTLTRAFKLFQPVNLTIFSMRDYKFIYVRSNSKIKEMKPKTFITGYVPYMTQSQVSFLHMHCIANSWPVNLIFFNPETTTLDRYTYQCFQ